MLPEVAAVKLGPSNESKGKKPVKNKNENKIEIILINLNIILKPYVICEANSMNI